MINYNKKENLENYRDAVSALMKAYQLGDLEVLYKVKETIYKDFGNAVGDNINSTAHAKLRDHKGE